MHLNNIVVIDCLLGNLFNSDNFVATTAISS